MIQLENDQLSFRFPNLEQRIDQLVASRREENLPQILSQSREAAFASLENSRQFKNAHPKDQKRSRSKLFALKNSEIESAFDRQIRGLRALDGSCGMSVNFQRTLRLPDDGEVYPLPAGLGNFPLRHVDDFGDRAPESWSKRGGVAMPMFQSEALWISFGRGSRWPFAVQIAAGKINAATGKPWTSGLEKRPQNYIVLPDQPWLDGFAVEKGVIRQFVAVPLGEGYSVEEQLTGEAEFGGLQFQVFPLRAETYFQRNIRGKIPTKLEDLFEELALFPPVTFAKRSAIGYACAPIMPAPAGSEMGLGAGGQMRQEIYSDPHDFEDWDRETTSRCFVHLSNALAWRAITGDNPPHPPLTAAEYERNGIPWFDHYRSDLDALEGSSELAGVKTVQQLHEAKTGAQLAGEGPVEVSDPIATTAEKRPSNLVREGDF